MNLCTSTQFIYFQNTTRLRFANGKYINDPRVTLSDTGNLNIKNITLNDNGNYLCAIRNSKGFATKSAFLTVITKPIITYHVPKIIQKSMKMTIRKEPLSTENKYDFEYISGTWLTLVLFLFVTLIFTVFALIKLQQRRSKSVSKYQLKISPIERINEIQYECPKYWVEVGIEDEELIIDKAENV